MKIHYNSVIRKLQVREVNGFFSLRIANNKRCRLYEKCPEYLQISLKRIISQQNLLLGHVIIGFSRDGKYILSYQCRITDDINFGYPCLLYKYSLHWWRFDYRKPARRIHMVPLFSGEDICNELHLLICQPPCGKYIIVHGTASSRQSDRASSCPSYLTVAPSPENTSNLNTLLQQTDTQQTSGSMAIHLKYESVFPHPPFVPSINMKLGHTIFLNSGDAVCAVSSYFDKCDRKVSSAAELNNELFQSIPLILNCLCHSADSKNKSNGISHIPIEQKSPLNPSNRTNDRACVISYDCHQTNNESSPSSSLSSSSELTSMNYPASVSCYVSYFSDEANQTNDEYTSPFDFTSTSFPIKVTRANGDAIKQTNRHKCLTGSANNVVQLQTENHTILTVKQIIFDAEQFLDNQFRCLKETGNRYISLQDYDMQIVQVCSWTNELIILIKTLVRLRVDIEDDRCCHSSSQSQYSKLATYSTSFLLSWNVISNVITILEQQPIVLLQKLKCKSRSHFRGLEEATELRKKYSFPANLNESVYSFSNHSVFSGKSMRYLLHPFQPLAIVM